MPNVSNSVIVPASSYTYTSPNLGGGKKLAMLSNGWIVAVISAESYSEVRFYVSKDNGSTWSILTKYYTYGMKAYGDIVSVGTRVYAVINFGTALGMYWVSFDALTVAGAITGGLGLITLDYTQMAGITLAYRATDNTLHVAFAAYVQGVGPFMNYVMGSIQIDGFIKWGAVEFAGGYRSGGPCQYPCITLDKDGIPVIAFETWTDFDYNSGAGQYQGAYMHIAILKRNRSLLNTQWQYVGDNWSAKNIYDSGNTSYIQAQACIVFVPQSVNGLTNGRLWAAWTGSGTEDPSYYRIRCSYSDDGGISWSAMQCLNTTTYHKLYPCLGFNKNNEIFVTFLDDINLNMRKYSSGAWGAVSTLLPSHTGANHLQDLTLNMTSPLFISCDTTNTSVSFGGAWSTLNNSVTEGDIGEKTSANLSSLLSYSITTDGAMSQITEKVNGVVTNTRTATSGQALSFSVTQAQWDAIKYGRYSDVAGTVNYISVECGGKVWKYTFTKKLSTSDDSKKVIKAIQDEQTYATPGLKANLAKAIRTRGGVVNDSDSLETMMNAIRKSQSSRWAAGDCSTDGNSMVVVSGLDFTPRLVVIITRSNSSGNSGTNYTYYTAYFLDRMLFSSMCSGDQFGTLGNQSIDICLGYVYPGGFKIRASAASLWFALE